MFGLIYCVTNTANGKQYVGQTTSSLTSRWSAHKYNAAIGKDTVLYRAIRKYSSEIFTIESIDGADSISELNEKERQYIASIGSLVPNGYNMCEGGDVVTRSKETRMRMSLAAVGRTNSVEHCKKISDSLRGRINGPLSDEHCQKISASLRGRKRTFCKRGHALDEANTYVYFGIRACKICRKERKEKYNVANAIH